MSHTSIMNGATFIHDNYEGNVSITDIDGNISCVPINAILSFAGDVVRKNRIDELEQMDGLEIILGNI